MFINHVINHVINHLQSLRFIGPPQWDDDEDPPICGRLVGMVYSWVYKKEIEIETFSYYLGIIYIYYCFFS